MYDNQQKHMDSVSPAYFFLRYRRTVRNTCRTAVRQDTLQADTRTSTVRNKCTTAV